jgi:hypothetical protein
VGVGESEVMVIEMPKGYSVPYPKQQSTIKRYKFKIPFLDLNSNPDSKE